jgi:nitroreductase
MRPPMLSGHLQMTYDHAALAGSGSMTFRELLRRRRMVRHYLREPVGRETLERIVSTVRRAPSAGYSQGQRLLVVSERALLDELAAWEQREAPEGVEPWFGTAAAHVLVLVREDDYHDRYREPDKLQDGAEIEWPVPFWFVDAGAALMLILLAAIDEGLAAGVYGVAREDEKFLRGLLKIPSELSIVAGVTLGKAAPDPEWSTRASRFKQRRRPPDDVVHWQSWST